MRWVRPEHRPAALCAAANAAAVLAAFNAAAAVLPAALAAAALAASSRRRAWMLSLVGAVGGQCDVKLLPKSLQCQGRAAVLSWLVQNEHSCLAPTPHDCFQFGVPSEMKSVASIATHRTYWGFDSFRGLPDATGETYQNPLWKPGTFSDVHELSGRYHVKSKPREGIWDYIPKTRESKPLSVDEAIDKRMKQLNGHASRIRLIGGFYNESLTPAVAASALPALFADFNCDLYTSTMDAQRWLFEHNLLRAGSIISYDDWFHTPFGAGESAAHMEIARLYRVHFEHLSASLRQGPGAACKLVFFRIRSVGVRAHADITPRLNHTYYWN